MSRLFIRFHFRILARKTFRYTIFIMFHAIFPSFFRRTIFSPLFYRCQKKEFIPLTMMLTWRLISLLKLIIEIGYEFIEP